MLAKLGTGVSRLCCLTLDYIRKGIAWSIRLHATFDIKKARQDGITFSRKIDSYFPRNKARFDLLILLPFFLFYVSFDYLLLQKPLFNDPYSTVLYDKNGVLLGASVATDAQWRFPENSFFQKLELNPKFKKCLTLYEDEYFYIHNGVNIISLTRAFIQNTVKKEVVSGASTLSMQTIRLVRKNANRSLSEKYKEMILALNLEKFFAKNDILKLYAAHAPFGGNVVGLEAASFRYFNRSPDKLSWAECALLAVLPNNPSLVHPGKNREVLLQKRNRLLEKLYKNKVLTEEEYSLSLDERLPSEPFPLPRLAPHLLERVRKETEMSREAAFISTVDADIQERVTSIVEKNRAKLTSGGIQNAACLVADVETGKILAYIGNAGLNDTRNYGQSVDIVTSLRSSGSILKPFLYAAELDTGMLLPEQLVIDIPTRIGSYSPENNVQIYSGAVKASLALARSLNVPAVRELRNFGIGRFYRLLKVIGFTTLFRQADDYGLTLVLGGAEVKLEEAVDAYASLARTCLKKDNKNYFFSLSYLQGEKKLASTDSPPISKGAAYITLETLLSVSRPNEEAAWQDFAGSKKIAWKTGTSFGYRDAWAIGVTSRYAVGVWVGNANGEGRPDLKGYFAAAPVLFEVFSFLQESNWFKEPSSDLQTITVCADSGYVAGTDCANIKRVKVPLKAFEMKVCPYCRTVHLSADFKNQVTTNTHSINDIISEKRFVLPPAVEYYYRKNNLSYKVLPEFIEGSINGTNNPDFSIIFPDAEAAIYIPLEIDGTKGKTVFQAAHRNKDAVLYWNIDDEFIGTTHSPHKIEVRPSEGEHILLVQDETGASIKKKLIILSEK